MQNEHPDERIEELLMQRVTGALSAPEADALSQAMAKLPPGELARWEAAAAELTAAFVAAESSGAEPLPASLADRVAGAGEAMVRSQPSVAPRSGAVAANSVPAPRSNLMTFGGWMLAAAALVLWLIPSGQSRRPSEVASASARIAALRDSLLTRDSAVQRLAWTATKDTAAVGAAGDVVWSAREQRGVMRFAGLQPNDRAKWQYQLWIFDKTRDQKYPVDGGVFDMPPGQSEVLVAIDARVPVGDAVMFAVTVEPAGGVVVSTRERIALLAQRGG